MLSRALPVCVFDAYGTLFDVHSAVAAHREAVGVKADAVSALWRQKQIEYSWLRTLMGAHVDFWQLTQDGLDFALGAHGISDFELREKLLGAYRTLHAYPDAAACLQGCAIGVAGSGSFRMVHPICSTARFHRPD